jgi:sigma54-dependent transcription regulator
LPFGSTFLSCYIEIIFWINMKSGEVVIGVLGTVLDKRGKRANRFRKWRPTVGLCQQPDFLVDRLELLHQPRDEGMAQQLAEDIALLSRTPKCAQHGKIEDPWDFEEVYAAFLDFATQYTLIPKTKSIWCISPPARTWRRSAGSC